MLKFLRDQDGLNQCFDCESVNIVILNVIFVVTPKSLEVGRGVNCCLYLRLIVSGALNLAKDSAAGVTNCCLYMIIFWTIKK